MKQETNYQLERRNRSDDSFKGLESKNFPSNYFQITFLPEKNSKNENSGNLPMIYQYQCQITQSGVEIEKGSRLYHTVIKYFKDDLISKVGYQMHHGQIIFGTRNQPKMFSFPFKNQLQFKDHLKKNGQEENPLIQKLEVVFTKVKETNLNQLSIEKDPETNHHILQILNINLKNKAKAAKLVQLSRTGKYYYNQVDEVFNDKKKEPELQVSRGFKFNIVPLNKGFSLLIDVSFRVMQYKLFSTVLLQQRKQQSKQEINQKYKGKSVTTKYGNFKNYQICEIDFKMNPRSKFILENGKETTYEEYYLHHHHKKIERLDQPMIKVLLRTQKIKKGDKIEKKEHHGYLIPQLVSLAGVTDEQSSSTSIMQNLSQITKISPMTRLKYCQEIKQVFNKQNDFMKIGEQITLSGWTLSKPELNYGAQEKLYQSATFQNQKYFLVYSQGNRKDSDKQDKQADKVLSILKDASKRYNIKFQDPVYITVKNNQPVDEWIYYISQDAKKYCKPKIIFFLLKDHETKYYKELKAYSINQLSCPTQCIRLKKFLNSKNQMSYASKLAIQMNTKVGCVPWIVNPTNPYFKNINVMHCGIATSKGKNGNYLSFVGTIKNNSSSYFSTCKKLQKNHQQNKKSLQLIFFKWAKTYFQSNDRKAPNLILIYRQGLNQVQAKKEIIDFEIPVMQSTLKKIMEATKTKIQPQYMIINVNKKINSRFFQKSKNQIGNPRSGSVIIPDMNSSTSFELAAQFVTQGTCTPTKFTILHDRSTLKNEPLISYTHDMCYQYYNWQGPVRVPAVEQYASKLALFCSGGIEEEIKQAKESKDVKGLTQTLFYL